MEQLLKDNVSKVRVTTLSGTKEYTRKEIAKAKWAVEKYAEKLGDDHKDLYAAVDIIEAVRTGTVEQIAGKLQDDDIVILYPVMRWAVRSGNWKQAVSPIEVIQATEKGIRKIIDEKCAERRQQWCRATIIKEGETPAAADKRGLVNGEAIRGEVRP